MHRDPPDKDQTRRAFPARAAESFRATPFVAHPVFRGGHAQTIAAYAWPRPYRFDAPNDVERLFEVEPETRLLARCRWQKEPPEHPTVVLWHGIEGSTSSVYMIAMADKAYRSGFNVVRVNLRNCGGTEHLTPGLYHGGLTRDLQVIVRELIEHDNLGGIVVIGFSLGGNLVLKLAAEYGAKPPPEILGVCVVSPSVDLRESAHLICRRANWIYHRDFVRRLKSRIQTKHKLFPHLYDLEKLALVRTIVDFDEHFTAPAHGFAGADDYYRQSSSIHLIHRINLPTLVVHAQDDPFIPFAPLRNPALAANPSILLLEPERGGHVAFISAKPEVLFLRTDGESRVFPGDLPPNHDSRNGDRFWAENRAIEFCRLLVEQPAA